MVNCEWKKVCLKDAADFLDHLRKPVSSSDRAKMKGVYPYYGASGIVDYVNDYIYDEPLILLGEDGENILSRNLPLAFLVDGKIWVNNHAHVLRAKEGVNRQYLCAFLESLDYTDLNSGTAQPKLNQEKCKNIEIYLPEFEEQTAIAEALSDMDSLISSLQKLIEKKKAIKQGTMQELLTGKKRLPGFSGEWKKERLGDISDIKDGTHGTFQIVDRGYPLLSAKNVYNNHLDIAENESLISTEDYYSIIANGFPRKGDILLSCVGTIGRCCIYSGMPKVAFQRSVAFIRVKECVARYILQYMQSENANKQLLNSANASAQAGVYLGAISDIEVYMPCCVKEQQAIAQVLSDMDSEIEQQEKKLAKYQQIKQGMMQELLTGRIRLV